MTRLARRLWRRSVNVPRMRFRLFMNSLVTATNTILVPNEGQSGVVGRVMTALL